MLWDTNKMSETHEAKAALGLLDQPCCRAGNRLVVVKEISVSIEGSLSSSLGPIC